MIEFFAVIKPPDHLIVPKSRFPDYRHVRLSAKILRLQDVVCISDDFAQESESRLKMGMFFPDEFAVDTLQNGVLKQVLRFDAKV